MSCAVRAMRLGLSHAPFSRQFLVGPNHSLPQPSGTPQFGKRRRHASVTGRSEVVTSPDAEAICKERYGFLRKPHFLTWSEFLAELKQMELQWSLVPGAGGVFQLEIRDNSSKSTVLCRLKGRGSSGSPISEFFDCCGGLLGGSDTMYNIHFIEGMSQQVLQVEKCNRIGGLLPDRVDDCALQPAPITQYDCRGTSVKLSVLDKECGLRSPLFNNVSLQTLNYAFLTSIPAFLKRMDIGVRNRDFVTAEQMTHFRFAWCFIRRESFLEPVEMTELDILLPPS